MILSKIRIPSSKRFLFRPLCRYLYTHISTISDKHSINELYQILVPKILGHNGHQCLYKDSKSYGEGQFDVAVMEDRLTLLLVSLYNLEQLHSELIIKNIIKKLEIDCIFEVVCNVYGSSYKNRKLALQTYQYLHKNKKLLIDKIKISGIPNLDKSNFYQAINASFLALLPRDIAKIVNSLFYHGAYDLDNLIEKDEKGIAWYYLRRSEINLENQIHFFKLEAKQYTRANDDIKHYNSEYNSYGYLYFKSNGEYQYVLREFQAKKDYMKNLYNFISSLIKLGVKSIGVEIFTNLIHLEAIQYLLSKGFIQDKEYPSMITLKAT